VRSRTSNLNFAMDLCEFQIRPVLLRNTFTAGKIFSQLPASALLIADDWKLNDNISSFFIRLCDMLLFLNLCFVFKVDEITNKAVH